MPTMLNVHEAKANFSGVLAEVENKLTIITIMRYGRPVAKIVPITPKRIPILFSFVDRKRIAFR